MLRQRRFQHLVLNRKGPPSGLKRLLQLLQIPAWLVFLVVLAVHQHHLLRPVQQPVEVMRIDRFPTVPRRQAQGRPQVEGDEALETAGFGQRPFVAVEHDNPFEIKRPRLDDAHDLQPFFRLTPEVDARLIQHLKDQIPHVPQPFKHPMLRLKPRARPHGLHHRPPRCPHPRIHGVAPLIERPLDLPTPRFQRRQERPRFRHPQRGQPRQQGLHRPLLQCRHVLAPDPHPVPPRQLPQEARCIHRQIRSPQSLRHRVRKQRPHLVVPPLRPRPEDHPHDLLEEVGHRTLRPRQAHRHIHPSFPQVQALHQQRERLAIGQHYSGVVQPVAGADALVQR